MGLFDFFTGNSQKKAADAAASAARQGFQSGYGDYSNMAGQARDAIGSNYGAGIAGYQPYQDAGTAGMGSYMDALGLSGPEGTQRAQQQFQTGPGYDFAMNQGLQAIDRRAASRGMFGSGNTNIDTMKYSQGLANQEWGNYLNRLQGLGTQGLQAAGGAGGLYANLGNALGTSFTGQGDKAWQMQTGIGNANAGAEVAKGNAETAASGNLWGALMGGAKLLTGMPF